MKVLDLVSFSKESYFNGAIQTDWFYELERRNAVACSFVFHGPKYYGVSSEDLNRTQHKLVDSASFVKNIADKLYISEPDNNFIMTIAGYGTGKSHLAVCLGTLFSGEGQIVSRIINRISEVDTNIATYIESVHIKKNLVILLNGMNNFNLDAEVLKCARCFLQQNGISDDILRKITKSYDIAVHFVEKMFDICKVQFEQEARTVGFSYVGMALKKYLLTHIEDDNKTLQVINKVYREMNGDDIHWDRGISAGDVLTLLQKELCGIDRPFNKILLLFDEFGRYIEYAATNPVIAGEAALQQVFEAVQNAKGKIIFTGFIQNDLSAYLSRIDKTANIIRYVGRYENSEKLYLSSNFETILANLLQKTGEYEKVAKKAMEKYEHFHNKMLQALNRWDRSVQKKQVWIDTVLYHNVILKGCYPLHPITVWVLSNMSAWMQQRSTIAFVAEMFEKIKGLKVDGTWLPYIYPVDIVDSAIYYEMLNSEEKGLVQSQYCMLYRDIVVKLGSKLSEAENQVLKAVLIINIGRFAFRDREDVLRALQYCSNIKEEDTIAALKSLEDLHGVVVYDENAKTLDLVAEANGFNEFKRVLLRYCQGISATIDDCDSNLLNELSLMSELETNFAQQHNISSTEWRFEKKLMDVRDIDSAFFSSYTQNLNQNYLGEKPRGCLVYAYCAGNATEEITRVSALYRDLNIQNIPLLILFLDDEEKEILQALIIKKAIGKFSVADKDRLEKHITSQEKTQNKKICRRFNQLVAQKEMLTVSGVEVYSGRLSDLCTQKFEALYKQAPAFAFDGFQNKITAQAKKYLANICTKMFDRTLMNIQSYQALTSDEKNRIRACLSTRTETSWKVFDDDCNLIEPLEPTIRIICEEVEEQLREGEIKSIFSVMGKYMKAPYGMNINAVALFVFYFIALQGKAVLCFYGQERLMASHLSDKIFKQSRLQPNEFLKLRIGLNVNAEVSIVEKICKEALQNKEIEKCSAIKKRLDDAIQQEGEIQENKILVGKARVCLDTGIALNNEIGNKLKKAKEIIEDAERELVIHKFVQVFEKIVGDETEPLSREYSFVCGESLKKEIFMLRQRSEKILQKGFMAELKKISCNITQISQMKLRYKKVAEILKENNYQAYAEALEKQVILAEEEARAKEQYKNALKDLEKDLIISEGLSALNYRETLNGLERMRRWRAFILNAKDLPEHMADLWLQRIGKVIAALEKREEKLKMDLNKALAMIGTATSLDEILDVEKELYSLEKQDYSKEMRAELESGLATVLYIKNAVACLPTSLDDLKELYPGSYDIGQKIIGNEILKMIVQAEEKQSIWVENVIKPVEESSDQMDARTCTSWLEKTEILPKYLSKDVVKRYEIAYKTVEERLHICRVEGVVSLFEQLSNEEKRKCLKILLRSVDCEC